MSENNLMNVKFFDSLDRRDFDNGAILDDIRDALKERQKMILLLARMQCCREFLNLPSLIRDQVDEFVQAQANRIAQPGYFGRKE